MSKETFLGELQKYLEILEDREQQDILQEYAQHIDIKVQNGQSEEEAIRDFGPVKELAAEILEAYHVKPEFGESRRKTGLPRLDSAGLEEGGKKLRTLGGFLKRKAAAFFAGTGRLFAKAGRGIRRALLGAVGLFRGKRRREAAPEEGEAKRPWKNGLAAIRGQENLETGGIRMEPERKESRQKETGMTAIRRFFGTLAHGIAALILWCLRLLWNVFWLFCAVLAGCFALLALFGFGMLLILVMQGYPLLGTVLICLGVFLCGGTASWGCFSLIRRKRQRKEADGLPEKGEPEEKGEKETEEEPEAETEDFETEQEPQDETMRQGGAL